MTARSRTVDPSGSSAFCAPNAAKEGKEKGTLHRSNASAAVSVVLQLLRRLLSAHAISYCWSRSFCAFTCTTRYSTPKHSTAVCTVQQCLLTWCALRSSAKASTERPFLYGACSTKNNSTYYSTYKLLHMRITARTYYCTYILLPIHTIAYMYKGVLTWCALRSSAKASTSGLLRILSRYTFWRMDHDLSFEHRSSWLPQPEQPTRQVECPLQPTLQVECPLQPTLGAAHCQCGLQPAPPRAA